MTETRIVAQQEPRLDLRQAIGAKQAPLGPEVMPIAAFQLSLGSSVPRMELVEAMLLALGQTILVADPVCADLLAVGHPALRVCLVSTKLGHSVLSVGMFATNLLATGHPILSVRPVGTNLLVLRRAMLCMLSIRTSLLALRRPVLRVVSICADLLAHLRACRIPVMLGACPDPLRLSGTLRVLARCALSMARSARLPLHAR